MATKQQPKKQIAPAKQAIPEPVNQIPPDPGTEILDILQSLPLPNRITILTRISNAIKDDIETETKKLKIQSDNMELQAARFALIK